MEPEYEFRQIKKEEMYDNDYTEYATEVILNLYYANVYQSGKYVAKQSRVNKVGRTVEEDYMFYMRNGTRD